VASSFYRERFKHEVDDQPFFEEISLEIARIVIEASSVPKEEEKTAQLLEKGKEKLIEGKELGGQLLEKGKGKVID